MKRQPGGGAARSGGLPMRFGDAGAADRREGFRGGPGCRGGRVVEGGAGGARLDDLARVHDEELVGEVRDEGHVVGDEHDGEAEGLLEFLDLDHEGALGPRRRARIAVRP